MNINMGQGMPQNAPTSVPTVDDLFKSMRVRVGLEQAPEKPVDPFAYAPVQEEPKAPASDMWAPMEKEIDNKNKEQEAAKLFAEDERFIKLADKLDGFLEKLGDEVVNIETPFGQKEAEEQLMEFLKQELGEQSPSKPGG